MLEWVVDGTSLSDPNSAMHSEDLESNSRGFTTKLLQATPALRQALGATATTAAAVTSRGFTTKLLQATPALRQALSASAAAAVATTATAAAAVTSLSAPTQPPTFSLTQVSALSR